MKLATANGTANTGTREQSGGAFVVATAFAALFSVVGLALYGLPLYYDFMVREFGWSRTMVTSGNAISKLSSVRCSGSRRGGSSIGSGRAG